MDQRLRHAFDVVLLDLRSSAVPIPELIDRDWADDPEVATAYLRGQDGGSDGIRVTVHAAEPDRIVEVADQVQEWVIHELWPHRPTNWPRCPEHPGTHPLTASTSAGVARWICPRSGTPFAPVGELNHDRRIFS